MISKWQEITVDFFVSDVLKKYWNHEEGTIDKVIEVQFFPALLFLDSNHRVFLGANIKPWSDYNEGRKLRDELLNKGGIKSLREFEEDYALGLLITREEKIEVAPLNHLSYEIFLASSLGYDTIKTKSYHVPFWFNVDENGDYDFSSDKPRPNRKIRIRIIDFPEFENIIREYKEIKKFPEKIIKNDIKIYSF